VDLLIRPEEVRVGCCCTQAKEMLLFSFVLVATGAKLPGTNSWAQQFGHVWWVLSGVFFFIPPFHKGVIKVRLLQPILIAALCLLVVSGCSGSGRLNTRGRIVKGGVPFTVPDEEYVRVTFFPVTTDGRPPANTYAATYNGADGTFRAVGPDGKGIPPGKYRIAVEHERNRKDLFRGAYDGDKSPFVFDIDASGQEIIIDLDKKVAAR
jgi:hypothetical protein